ncbi:MAG: hypothetical protein ABR596_02605 [Halarsenatibacteraceae bacterium]
MTKLSIPINNKIDSEDIKHLKEIIAEDKDYRKEEGKPIPDQYGVILDEGQIRIKKYFFNKEKPAAPKGTTDQPQ